MNALTTGQIVAIITPIVALLVTILGSVLRFNNNVVKSQVILTRVVDDVADLQTAQSNDSKMIAKLVGAFNEQTRKKIQYERPT